MAKMIKFAICDDEPLMAQEISGLISQYMEEKKLPSYCVKLFFDSCSLLESGCDFDVLFLDIQMEKPNGIETARTLRQRGNQSLMIFVIGQSGLWSSGGQRASSSGGEHPVK